MPYGHFYSVLTNAQLPQPGTAEPGSVYWVNSTGLLWFGVGDGTVVQLLASVPIPTIGPEGPQGIPGAQGEQGPLLQWSGNWSPSPTVYLRGSVVSYNSFVYLANSDRNISDNTLAPEGNPFWTIIASIPPRVAETELCLVCDGAGAPPNLGFKGTVTLPFACRVTGYTIFADQVGSASFDVKWATYDSLPSTVSIVGSANPQLVSQQKNEGDSSAWSPTLFEAGDVLQFDLLSVDTVLFLTLNIQISAT
jgi:hypothetical protein